jgi:hypothetical protein
VTDALIVLSRLRDRGHLAVPNQNTSETSLNNEVDVR